MKSTSKKLTLPEAFEKHYDKSELRPATILFYEMCLRRWAELTDDPDVRKIDNQTIAKWRAAMLERYAPATVQSAWTCIRAVLRLLAPSSKGNPWGIGLIDGFPAMKPVRRNLQPPRRLPLEVLDKFYVGCRHAKFPQTGTPAAWWWQALVAVAYFSGLRRSDLFALRFDQFDFEGGTIAFTAEKTGKSSDRFPLHPVAAAHVQRIRTPRKLVFGDMNPVNGDFYGRLRRLCEKAGVERFTLQDLRRVGASEAERARAGMGSVFLQHRQHDVTSVFYVNQAEELAEAVANMRVPLAFKHGIGFAERAEKKREKETVQWQESLHSLPYTPEPDEWKFDIGSVWFAGRWHSWKEAAPKRVLEVLATLGRPAEFEDVAAAIWGNQNRPTGTALEGRVHGCISVVRDHLRVMLYLDAEWNPVPCIERGNGGRWCLLFPSRVKSTC